MIDFVAFFLLSINLLHLSGLSVAEAPFPDNAKSNGRSTQNSRKWYPATHRNLTMGKSKRADMIRVLGQPKRSELFHEVNAHPEYWYHYDSGGEFPGDLVFNVDKRSGVILRMTLHPKNLTLKEAIKRFGENYVITRYEFCPGFEEHDSAPLYENPSGQFRYIEYRKRGIALAIGNDDRVNDITYVSEPVGTTSSKCKKAGK